MDFYVFTDGLQCKDSNQVLWVSPQCATITPHCVSNISTLRSCMTVSYSVPTAQALCNLTLTSIYQYVRLYHLQLIQKSEWWDSNPRSLHPKCSALPIRLHPVVWVEKLFTISKKEVFTNIKTELRCHPSSLFFRCILSDLNRYSLQNEILSLTGLPIPPRMQVFCGQGFEFLSPYMAIEFR